MADEHKQQKVEVRVSFPASKHGPYVAEVARDDTAGAVLAAAMTHFEVHDDPQFTYVLAHDGQEQNTATTIGTIAGESHEVRFTLIKKITQG